MFSVEGGISGQLRTIEEEVGTLIEIHSIGALGPVVSKEDTVSEELGSIYNVENATLKKSYTVIR
jgi:hypothetical protein